MMISGCVRITSTTTSAPNLLRSVRAYDRIFDGHEVGLCLILQQPLDTRPILERPLHVGHETGTGKAGAGAAFADAVDNLVRPIAVEGATTEMCISPLTHIEPPVRLRRRHVNAGRRKSLHVLRSPARINDVNGLFTGVQPVSDEGEQNPIVIVGAVEESTDMTVPAQSRPAQPEWSAAHSRARARCERTVLVSSGRLWHARLYRTAEHRTIRPARRTPKPAGRPRSPDRAVRAVVPKD